MLAQRLYVQGQLPLALKHAQPNAINRLIEGSNSSAVSLVNQKSSQFALLNTVK
jgi:hypothetical protein